MENTALQTAALDMAAQYGRLSLEGLGLSDYAHRYVSDYRSNPDALAANWLRSARIIDSATGDWYFSGDYPTPGGNKVVCRSFVNFIEGRGGRAY